MDAGPVLRNRSAYPARHGQHHVSFPMQDTGRESPAHQRFRQNGQPAPDRQGGCRSQRISRAASTHDASLFLDGTGHGAAPLRNLRPGSRQVPNGKGASRRRISVSRAPRTAGWQRGAREDQYFFLARLAGLPRSGSGGNPSPSSSPLCSTRRKSILRSSMLAFSTRIRTWSPSR